MATKELTKDSITGAIFNHIKVRAGEHWMNDEEVVEVTLKSEADSNSANIYVLSHAAAYSLARALDRACQQQQYNWALNQTRNWPDAEDWHKFIHQQPF